MKPPYVPLRNLNENTKDYKVRIKVLEKSPAKTSPKKNQTRFQKLVFRDEEGTRMHATLFNDDIESYSQGLRKYGEYEVSGATIQTVPENLQTTMGEYQMTFNSRVRIAPINTQACTDQPQYTTLSSVIEQRAEGDEIYDIVAVVIAIDDIQTVGQGEVRHITIVDNSVQRPMTLSAWNAYAKEAGEVIASPTQGLSIVGFHAVKKARYRGVSLKTTMCTELVVNPKGPISDMLRKWIKENMTTLHSWVTKCHALKGSSSARVITPVVEIERRKPNTVWQDESFWINITAPSVYASDVYCYVGCDKCGRRANLPPNTAYKCQHCTAAQSETTLRVSFQFFVTDGEGSVRVIAFGKEAEKVLATTTEDLHRQKNNDDQAELDATLSAVENKNMLLQIVPSSALTTSYVLKWVVRAVEAAAVVKKEPDDLKIEDETSQAEGISPNEENFLQAEHEE